MSFFLNKLSQNQSLTEQESYECLKAFFSGQQSDTIIADTLIALSNKGESADEILGFTRCLRDHCLSIPYETENQIIDCCGTGGSSHNRFNISTVVAFVLASGDIKVAKHGNYGSKQANGSFNFLESLDISFQLQPPQLIELLEQSNLCFLFARLFHPAMRFVAKARQQIARRSIFNLIGPLANPMTVRYNIIGLPNDKHLNALIHCVQKLPITRVSFCIGGDERDEISLSGTSRIISVTPSSVKESSINFSEEISAVNPDYFCGSSADNASFFSDLLKQKNYNHPLIKHIAINAALGFVTVDRFMNLIDAYEFSMELFRTEQVSKKIQEHRELAKKLVVK
jgi:anthranilate phosphoribosyltransferase